MNNDKTKSGLIWSAIERIGTQGLQLIIMLYLGRILGPGAFGYIGILSFFISLAQVLIDSGFSAALIRKNKPTDQDYSTVFIFNIILSFCLYGVLYFISGEIAVFYKIPELENLLNIFAISIIINAFTIIPKVILTIEIDFKTQAKISLISAILSSGAAVFLASMGYGVWSLVAQTLLYSITNCILINILNPWYPVVGFNINAFKELFSFSSKLLLSGILDAVYNNLYQLVIGKNFTPQLVGQFTQANQLTSVPAMTLTNIIQRVTYPIFCRMLHNKSNMQNAYFDTIKIASVIVFPVLLGIGVISKPLLLMILGHEWLLTSKFLSYLCLGYMLYPVHAININILQVNGRSDLFLILEVIKKMLLTFILLLTVGISVEAMILGLVVHSYLSFFLNAYYTQKVTNITIRMQCLALFPIWLGCIACAFISYQLSALFQLSSLLSVLTIIVINTVTYLIAIRLINKKLFYQIISIIKK